MNIKSIAALVCIVVVFIFGVPEVLGFLTRPSYGPGIRDHLGILLYIFLVLVCFFLLPAWAFFKRKRKVVALILVFIGLFSTYIMYSYFRDPESFGGRGLLAFVVYTYIPPGTFIVQLFVYIGYIGYKVAGNIRANGKHAS